MKLKDKIVLVTGGTRGIGRAIVELFVNEGAKVAFTYVKNEKLAGEFAVKLGESVLPIKADVSVENDVKNAIRSVIERFGRLDVLINNAGEIVSPGDWQSDVDTWKRTLDVNLTGAWLFIRESASLLKETNGVIVNIASVYGFLGAAPVLAYTSAKGGLITLTKSFAKELAPEIRVNAIAPSNVMTDMTKGAGTELIEKFRKDTPLLRIAEPIEIAKAALFLSSEDSSYITGELLVVDGGYSLK